MFPDFGVLIESRVRHGLEKTDYDRLLDLYTTYSDQNSRGGIIGRTHAANMSRAKLIITFLKTSYPMLPKLTANDVDAYLRTIMVTKGSGEDKYQEPATPKTIKHILNLFNILMDLAVKERMAENGGQRREAQ